MNSLSLSNWLLTTCNNVLILIVIHVMKLVISPTTKIDDITDTEKVDIMFIGTILSAVSYPRRRLLIIGNWEI